MHLGGFEYPRNTMPAKSSQMARSPNTPEKHRNTPEYPWNTPRIPFEYLLHTWHTLGPLALTRRSSARISKNSTASCNIRDAIHRHALANSMLHPYPFWFELELLPSSFPLMRPPRPSWEATFTLRASPRTPAPTRPEAFGVRADFNR